MATPAWPTRPGSWGKMAVLPVPGGQVRSRGNRSVQVIATTLALGLLAAACSGGEPRPEPSPRPGLTAIPVDPGTSTPGGPDLPAPAPTTSGSPSPSVSPTERDPSDTDRARFVSDYRPDGASDLEHVAIDVDGDGIEELVFVYVRASAAASRVDVAWWDGTAYGVEWSSDGGAADRVDQLTVRDLNGDGRVEVAVNQSVGTSGRSATVWGVAADSRRLDPLVAQGGCHGGTNTYGVVGADIEDRDGDGAAEIYATCDDSPLPLAAWTTDVYVWRDGAYRFDRTRFPGEG